MEDEQNVFEGMIRHIVQKWTLFDPNVRPFMSPPRDFITDVAREISRFSQAQGSTPAFSLQGKWIVATSSTDTPHPFDLHDLAMIMGAIVMDRHDGAGPSRPPRHDRDRRDMDFANAMTGISFPGFIFR